ncbi:MULTISPECIES: alpha/beta hydrolase [unclassified Sphingopyxis]|uniref:alpha/beta fold hydrolase n=1 Tax=unclassified Sphingopyxis TaxID=2614943 RepID=UPI0024AE6AC6|nr:MULTISPECIES: alpha/beta hydrolase [unclassified Sphingopyxis]
MPIETIELRNGPLRFTARSAGTGPLVLCLHGFPDNCRTFDALLPALAEAGYRAVAPTMRGYEASAQPEDQDYHAIRMAEDVASWIEQLGGGLAHLIGHDWGATIALGAALLAPERVASLTMMSVPHPAGFAEFYAIDPAQQARSHYILEFQEPGAEDRLLTDDCEWLERLWRTWSPGWDIPADILKTVRETFRQPGVAAATLGWYRQAFDIVSDAGQATQALFARLVTVPTMGLVGEDDGCVGADIFVASMREADFPAGLEVEVIGNAGHFLHLEARETVSARILHWLASGR